MAHLQRPLNDRSHPRHHPPITAFVAAGFEHSVANMYFIPLGLFVKAVAPLSFWWDINRTPADFSDLTWGNFFANNLIL
jgi:formate transporter